MEAAQIKDGIADQLTGAVEGDVAATIAVEELDGLFRQQLLRGQKIFATGVAAEGDYGGVLQQRQRISDSAFFAQINQRLLQTQSGGVINGAELENGNH